MEKGLTSSGLLKAAPYRHCFVSFPHTWRSLIESAIVPTFRLESTTHSLIVSWAGFSHDPGEEGDTIYISSKILHANGFAEREVVMVRQIPCPLSCPTASLSAVSETDWEGLLLNAETASEAFLSQLRVIAIGHIFPLWLTGGAVVYLKVIKLSESSSLGLLHSNSQVEILPPSHASFNHSPLTIIPSSHSVKENHNHIFKDNLWKVIYFLFSLLRNGQINMTILPKQNVLLGLRAIPYFVFADEEKVLFKFLTHHPALVLISKKHLTTTMHRASSYFIGKVSKVKNSKENVANELSSSQESSEKVTVIVLVWEKLKDMLEIGSSVIYEIDILLSHKTCLLSDSLIEKFSLHQQSMIILESCKNLENTNNLIIDVSVREKFHKVKDFVYYSLKSLFTDFCKISPIIINDFCKIKLEMDKKTDIIITTRDKKSVFIDSNSVASLSMNIEIDPNLPLLNKTLRNQYQNQKERKPSLCIHEPMIQDLVELIRKNLNLDINLSTLCPEFILLQGPKGSGKTTLIEALEERLRQSPFFVNSDLISLKLLKGKRVDSVQKILKMAIQKAQNFQPSLILLDDLDFLVPVHSEIEESKMLTEYYHYMAVMIQSLLIQLLETMKRSTKDTLARDSVVVLATCCSSSSVHSYLSTPMGNHIFSQRYDIPPLSKEEKLNMLQYLLKNIHEMYHNENIFFDNGILDDTIFCYDKDEILLKLEGFSLPDIRNFANRIYLQSKARWNSQQKANHCYISEDVKNALCGFLSLSSRGFKLPVASAIYTKIGGLHEARQTLNEMILWPSQFPHLFSQNKLRLHSGILLYGPPGCGKTLLAQSFQSFNHLSFITVKGPELLSKYIGQSEKSVRKAFERAQSAKPCILFFDEFESIAPRRGHDNTGVTDRVVNQLLTQMDGVEGHSGIYILAATSRPDLVDPALLRPGRLDKGIYCPIPSQSEREEILSNFAQKMNFQETLDVKGLAQRTEGYTGADLQSLLATAQIKAAQEAIGTPLYEAALNEGSRKESTVEDASLYEEFAAVLLDKNNGIDTSRDLGGVDDGNKSFNGKSKDFPSQTEEERLQFVTIKKEDIEEALGEVRPSVSDEERLKFDKLHRMFSNDDNTFAIIKAGERETLA